MNIISEIETGLPPYPYPGLRPFGHKESSIFFGRDKQIDELLELLEDNRFLAVVGPSGCGKSSLVRAGMIPALEAGFMASASFQWNVAVMRPGNQPIRRLSQALLESSIFESESKYDKEAAAFLQATLRRGPLGLIEAVQQTPVAHGQNLLLLVDQFEEVFRFDENGDSSEARAFVDLLMASAKVRDVPVYVVITMRSDFLGNCPVFSGLPEAMNNSQFLAPRLTREQNRLVIECPAGLFNATIEERVVTRILNEMGTDPDQLPLMQHLLMRMWRFAIKRRSKDQQEESIRLTLDDYHAAGGLKKALSSHVQLIYDRLGSDKRKMIAETLFRRLTEITPEGQVIRRFVTISEVAKALEEDESEVKSVIEKFRAEGRSFLMPPTTDILELSSTTSIDISHESLIRQWRQLECWTEDEAKARRIEEMLTNGTNRWQEEGRDKEADIEQKFVLTGVDLEETLEWEKSHLSEIEQPEWEQQREFLRRSEFYRDEVIRQEEAAKHAIPLANKAKELEEKNNQLKVATIREKKISRNLGYAVKAMVGSLLIALAALFVAYAELSKAEKAGDKAENESADAKKAGAQAVEALRDSKTSARAQKILSEAANVDDPELSFLLGIEASRVLESRTFQDLQLKRKIEVLIRTFLDRKIRGFETSGIDRQNLVGHEEVISAVDNSPDGRWLVTASYDKTARLWDLREMNDTVAKPIILKGHSDRIYDVEFSPNGKYLVTVSGDRTARLWNLQTISEIEHSPAAPQNILYHTERIHHVDISNRWLLAGGENGNVQLWDLNDLEKDPRVLTGHRNQITSLTIGPDDKSFVTVGADRQILLWDTLGNKYDYDLSNKSEDSQRFGRITVARFFFDSDHKYLITGAYNLTSRIWDLSPHYKKLKQSTKQKLFSADSQVVLPSVKLSSDHEGVTAAAISSRGKYLATGNLDGQISLWDLSELDFKAGEFKSAYTFAIHHSGPVNRIEFSVDGKWLATGSNDETPFLWKMSRVNPIQIPPPIKLTGHRRSITRLAFSSIVRGKNKGEQWLVTGDRDGKAVLWNLSRENSLVREPKSNIQHAAFSPNGELFAAAGVDGSIRSWKIKSNPTSVEQPILITKAGAFPSIRSITISDDSRWLATGDDNDQILVRDLRKTSVPIVLKNPAQISAIRFSKNNSNRLISGNIDSTAIVWDFSKSESKKSWILMGHKDKILDVGLSADDKWAATAAFDSISPARLWKLEPDSPFPEPITLPGHSTMVRRVEFGHARQDDFQDITLLATGDNDGGVRLFKIFEDGTLEDRVVVETPAKPQTVNGLRFSSNNRWLATGNRAGAVHLVNVTDPDSESVACIGHTDLVNLIEFSPDNRWLITGGSGGELCLWDLNQLQEAVNPVTEIRPSERFTEHNSGIIANKIRDNGIIAVKFRTLVNEKNEETYELLSAGNDGTVRSRIAKEGPPFSTFVKMASKTIGRNLTNQEWQDYNVFINTENKQYHKTFKNVPVHPTNFEKTKILARSGKIQKAITELQNLFVLDGSEFEAAKKRATSITYIEYGRQLAKDSKHLEAIEAFENAGELSFNPELEIHRLSAPALLQQGRVLARKGYLDDARKKLLKAQEFDPSMLFDLEVVLDEVLQDQIRQRWKTGRSDEAFSAYLKLKEGLPDSLFKPDQEAKLIVDYLRFNFLSVSQAEMAKLLHLAKSFDSSLDLNPEEEAKLFRINFLISEVRKLSVQGEMGKINEKLDEVKRLNPQLDIETIRSESEVQSFIQATKRLVEKERIVDQERTKNEISNLFKEENLKSQYVYEAALLPISKQLIEQGKQLALNGNINIAIRKFKDAKKVVPQYYDFDPAAYANRIGADQLIRELVDRAEIQEAINLYNHTRKIDPSINFSTKTMNLLAWHGSLAGHAGEVLTIANSLVIMDPTSRSYRDTRGVVRAFSGYDNADEIISDFEAYVAIPDVPFKAFSRSASTFERHLERRRSWLEQLHEGKAVTEVFDDTIRNDLIKEESSEKFREKWKAKSQAPTSINK